MMQKVHIYKIKNKEQLNLLIASIPIRNMSKIKKIYEKNLDT